MKSGELVRQFGVSSSTIRRWSAEFSALLSTSEGKHRSYTADDFLVMATIHELSKEGLTLAAIRKRLEEGYRVEDTSVHTIGYSDGRMVPAVVVGQIIDSTELRVEIESLKQERDRLLEMLKEERENSQQLQKKFDGAQKEWQEKHEANQTEMKELLRDIGKLEGELNYRNRQEGKGDKEQT